MAQTNEHMTSKHSTLEISADDTWVYDDVATWTDISGSANSVEPGGGASMTGSAHSLGNFHLPLIGIGKREAAEVTVKVVYTENAAEATALLDGYAEAQTLVWLRHRPRGSAAGAWEWVGRGYITERAKPATDAESADILLVEFPWFGREWDVKGQATT